MLSCKDVYWGESDCGITTVNINEKRSRKNKRNSSNVSERKTNKSDLTGSQKHTPKKNKSFTKAQKSASEAENLVASGDSSTKNDVGATLKDLNPQDKQRIAQLIQELAKVGEEKENIVNALNDERQKFVMQVQQMEEEKRGLMNKQQFLAEEVKQCQTLLQYYQNLITMQQTTLLAKEESKAQLESPRIESRMISNEKQREFSSSLKSESVITSTEEIISEDIRVNDAYDEQSSNASLTEDDVLRMSDSQYRIFLKRKKEMLKKEQESLRKLLLMKESSTSDPEFERSSPIRNFVDKSTGPPSSLKKRSIPIQTLSPIPMKESVSFISPSKSTSTETGTGNKSYTSTHSSSSTLRQTVNSPERILHLLSQDLESDALPIAHDMTNSKYSILPSLHESNLRSSSNNLVSTSVTSCEDDSQILQDIFFVS